MDRRKPEIEILRSCNYKKTLRKVISEYALSSIEKYKKTIGNRRHTILPSHPMCPMCFNVMIYLHDGRTGWICENCGYVEEKGRK